MGSRREELAIGTIAGIEVLALAGLAALVATRALAQSPGTSPFGDALPVAPPLVRVALSCLVGGAVGGLVGRRVLGSRRRLALALLLPGALFIAMGWAAAMRGGWVRMELSAERLEIRMTRGWCVPWLEIPVMPETVEYRATAVTTQLEAMGLLLPVSREEARWDLCHLWHSGGCNVGGSGQLASRMREAYGQEWSRLLVAEPIRHGETWRRALAAARGGDAKRAAMILDEALAESNASEEGE